MQTSRVLRVLAGMAVVVGGVVASGAVVGASDLSSGCQAIADGALSGSFARADLRGEHFHAGETITFDVTPSVEGPIAGVTILDVATFTVVHSINTDEADPPWTYRFAEDTAEVYPSGVNVTVDSDLASLEGLADWTVTCTEGDPAEEPVTFESLTASVEDADLAHGIERSLLAKLANAARQADQGRVSAACGPLGAFADQVDALSGGKVGPDTAAALGADAAELGETVGC